MDATEVMNEIKSLKEDFGDNEVMIKVKSPNDGFFKKITGIDIQQGMIDDEGDFVDEIVILVTCE
ncbi:MULTISPECIES: hypothetical protein [unclassified Enterococcus]|uniref:hypothetical protein n=1 Tax=unclassified Enterococcus TaxID=2608891 RepID=UPI003F26DB2D